jgi:hypothetical protein
VRQPPGGHDRHDVTLGVFLALANAPGGVRPGNGSLKIMIKTTF